MMPTADQLKKLAILLLSPELDAVRLGLKILLGQEPNPTLQTMLGFLWYTHPEPVRTEIDSILREQLAPNHLNTLLEGMSLLQVPLNKYIWYSQHTYNTSESELLSKLSYFQQIQTEYENLFNIHPQFFRAFQDISYIIWTYYRRPEAEPFIHKVIHYKPELAESHFYLGQIYQQALAMPEKALEHYQIYVSLAPEAIPYNEFALDEWFIEYRNYRPSTLEALTEMGNLQLELNKNIRLAKKYYRQAIDLAPKNHQAPYIHLAKLLEQEPKQIPKALKLYIQMAQIYQESKAYKDKPQVIAQLYLEIAKKYQEKLQDHNQALHFCKEAKRFDAKNTEVLLMQIELVLRHYRDYWQAKSLCQKVLSIDPKNSLAKQYLTEVEQQLKP